MQVIITDAWSMKGRTFYLSGLKLGLVAAGLTLILSLALTGLFHYNSARWKASAPSDGQSDRVVQENLEAMARQMGELSVRLTQIESLAERVSGLAGLNPAEIKPPARGGPLVSFSPVKPEVLDQALTSLRQRADHQIDLMTVVESRLIDEKVRKMMLPTQAPVLDHAMGSRFGWRSDPFTGQSALHTGLDFPADVGTPIVAAAGGLVVAQEFHHAYGNLLEIDHGNDVVTRYAHLSRSLVKAGELVRRGQHIAEVGNSGRSTGPHLHFEVLVQGVYQNPEVFLRQAQKPVGAPPTSTAVALPR